MSRATLYVGDALEVLRTLPDESVQCCVTSPPYFGLRDYGTGTWEGGDENCDHRGPVLQSRKSTLSDHGEDGRSPYLNAQGTPYRGVCGKCGATRIDQQLGLEKTPEEYTAKLVAMLREVRRVLRDDGTLWLNLGDSYAGSWGAQSRPDGKPMPLVDGGDMLSARQIEAHPRGTHTGSLKNTPGLKSKDLIGIPWRVAFALQADGWWLRRDIIWAKKSCMPESVTDRPTTAHEYVFLLSRSKRYFYDADAIAEPCKPTSDLRLDERGAISAKGNKDRKDSRQRTKGKHSGQPPQSSGHRMVENVARARAEGGDHDSPFGATRNARSVWTIATKPYTGAHYAVMPAELAERCVKAGSRPGDTVLDPFGGSGTTASVATGLSRNAIHIDLNPDLSLAIERIGPLLVDVKEVAA